MLTSNHCIKVQVECQWPMTKIVLKKKKTVEKNSCVSENLVERRDFTCWMIFIVPNFPNRCQMWLLTSTSFRPCGPHQSC